MNATTKLEAEHLCHSLRRDYRNLRKAVMLEDPDVYTQTMINKLGRTIEEANRMLTDLQRQLTENK